MASKLWANQIRKEIRSPAGRRDRTQCGPFPIFRVHAKLREFFRRISRKDIFDPSFLSLGLFSELDCKHISKAATQFKIVVVKGIIEYVNQPENKRKTPLGWRALLDDVIPDPGEMRQLYDLDETQREPDAIVRDVLALDSVFLCGYLCAYLLHKSYPESLYGNIISDKSKSLHQDVLNDIVKLQNQVPLVLIQNVLTMINGSKEKGLEDLRTICREWVLHHSKSLPGFYMHRSIFKFKEKDRQQKWKFEDCTHLLGCLCHVMKSTKSEANRQNADHKGCAQFLRGLGRRLDGCGHFRECLGHEMESRGSRANSLGYNTLPPASKLREKGIHFQGIQNGTGNLVPIFKRRRFRYLSANLYIPTFSILQNTELVWRNMLAYILDGDSDEPNHELGADLQARSEEEDPIGCPSEAEVEEISIAQGNLNSTPDILDRNAPDFELPELEHEHVNAQPEARRSSSATDSQELSPGNEEMLNEERQARKDLKTAAADFVCFMMFMDEIIDTKEDVALLRDGPKPVIQENKLGTNEDVAELFNKIARQQTTPSTTYRKEWHDLKRDIDNFLSDRRRHVLLQAMRHYFGKPWLAISVLAALLLLLMTFVQTVLSCVQTAYAIKSYKNM